MTPLQHVALRAALTLAVWALIIWWLVGCARPLPPVTAEVPTLDDHAAIAATIATWNGRRDLSDVDAAEAFDRIRITDPPDADAFRSHCGGVCAPSDVAPNCTSRWGRASACGPIHDPCFGPFCGLFFDTVRLVVIAPGRSAAVRPGLIVHEVVHHLSELAGMDSDRNHVDPRRWCDYSAGGCAGDNVEHVAREALR